MNEQAHHHYSFLRFIPEAQSMLLRALKDLALIHCSLPSVSFPFSGKINAA